MNKAEIAGVVRAFLAAGASWAIAKDWLPIGSEEAQGLVVAVTTMLMAGWSIKAKRKAV